VINISIIGLRNPLLLHDAKPEIENRLGSGIAGNEGGKGWQQIYGRP
jgi:hypothetical protein